MLYQRDLGNNLSFATYQVCEFAQPYFFNWIIVARRSNQSILRERNPEYSLEELMLKLKLQYFGQLMRRANSLKKILMLERLKTGGKVGGRG